MEYEGELLNGEDSLLEVHVGWIEIDYKHEHRIEVGMSHDLQVKQRYV